MQSLTDGSQQLICWKDGLADHQIVQRDFPLTRRNRLVNADTGTGKTMVYLAPIIDALQSYETRVTRSDGTLGM